MKKSETPSIPKLKFKFKKGIHNNLLTNWKEPIDLLKKNHKNKETTYKKQDVFKAISFNKEWFEVGTNNNKKIPIKGNTIRKTNKFDTSNHEKFNIKNLEVINCKILKKIIFNRNRLEEIKTQIYPI